MRSNAAFRFVLADCIARKEQIFSTFYDKEENNDNSGDEGNDQSLAKIKASNAAVGELQAATAKLSLNKQTPAKAKKGKTDQEED